MSECPCLNCRYCKNISGDAHKKCINPPVNEIILDSGGDNARKKATKIVEGDDDTVVRVCWPGSGVFPLIYDIGTVLKCSNSKVE